MNCLKMCIINDTKPIKMTNFPRFLLLQYFLTTVGPYAALLIIILRDTAMGAYGNTIGNERARLGQTSICPFIQQMCAPFGNKRAPS